MKTDDIEQIKIKHSAYLLVYIRREDAESLFQPINDESIPNHLKHFNDLIKIQFAHKYILKKNSISRINGFFPPNSISKYNDRFYHELSFVEMLDKKMATYDLFERISNKLNLDPTQIRLWQCDINDLPKNALVNAAEIILNDYFEDKTDAKIVIQIINEDDQIIEFENYPKTKSNGKKTKFNSKKTKSNGKKTKFDEQKTLFDEQDTRFDNPKIITVFIKFFFTKNLLRKQILATSGNSDDSNELNKQLQVPLQYLGSVFVKIDDDVESLVPFINRKIGLNDDLELEAFRFKPNGNVKKLSLDKSFELNSVIDGSILVFQVSSESVENIPKNSLEFDFEFEFDDEKNQLFKYDDRSISIHDSLRSIESYVMSDYGRCTNKIKVMEKQIEKPKTKL
mgnify:CR=1 FL=1